MICFDSYELDVDTRELRRGRERVRLQAQPFELLAMMLEHPGDVVTRAALAKRLWPEGTFVDFEHSLNAAMKRLRAALGDDADNPRFVETLPRRGYRFIAPVGGSPQSAGAAGASAPRAAIPYLARVAVLPFSNLSGDASYTYDQGTNGKGQRTMMKIVGLLLTYRPLLARPSLRPPSRPVSGSALSSCPRGRGRPG